MGRALGNSILLLALATGTLPAQFFNLASTEDGAQVYFATNLRLIAEIPQKLPPTNAIYRVANGAIERLTTPPPPAIEDLPFHSYADGNPQVSGDGAIFSYTLYNNCGGGSACIQYPSTATSYLTVGSQPPQTLPGEAQISRNGRFVLNYLTTCCPIPAQPDIIQLHDLQSGATATLPLPPASGRQSVTGSGAALLLNRQTGTLTLWSSQSATVLHTAEPAKWAIINDALAWVVYEAFTGEKTELRAFEIASGRDLLLASTPSTYWAVPLFDASIGDDGSSVLYLAPPQPGHATEAWTVHPDATGQHQLTTFPGGVTEAILAGNGQTAIAATGDNRLVSIDVATGAVTDLIPATPICYPGFVSLIPGSILPLRGSGLAAASAVGATPLPKQLGGVQLLINGAPLPLLSVSPDEIWFQAPFELAPGPTVTVSLPQTSPFAGCPAIQVPVVSRDPYFLNSPGNLVLVHQDFSGLVTAQSPARPGEVIVAYAVGLGAVTPPMTTGVPAPVDQLFPLADPFECRIGYGGGPPLDVPFAGLAPGMIGIYQVNVRMPDPLPAGSSLFLNCGTPGSATERGGGTVPIAPQQLTATPRPSSASRPSEDSRCRRRDWR
ncbi:MAG TPA: hypothetical protein VKX45_04435 [Bryobacteraceae bacterium]|nr:hypothetical protein [Bryobacteraceae bacterium]